MADLREPMGRINALARGFMESQVLFVANEAGLFPWLEEPRAAEDVAAKMDWDPRAARMLLQGLVALGLAARSGDLYQNSPVASACLTPGRPGYQGHIVQHLQHTLPGWLRLREALRTGTAAQAGPPVQSAEEVRSFILGMKDIARMSAREILGAVNLAPYKHLLDLGAGPGTYTIAFLQAHPGMKATVFDRPEVLPIAREEAEFCEVGHRVKFMAGDLTVNDLGSGYDLVLVSNVIHSFSSEKNRKLVRKCFHAMEPGGLLIIKDFLVDNDRSGPPFSLMFALHMLVGTGEGDTYSFAEVEQWTRDAGFEEGRSIDLTPQSRLWLAKKPFPAHKSSLIGFLDKTPPSKLPHGDFSSEE